MKTALITGVTGQDGSWMAELLLKKEYKVIGLKRRTSTENLDNIKDCLKNENFELVEGDVIDQTSIFSLLKKYKPELIFNLAAQSQVKTSFEQPFYTIQCNLLGPLNFLESIRLLQDQDYRPRFYQASTSEMWGKNYTLVTDYETAPFVGIQSKYQNIETPFAPMSPYGVAKLGAHELVRIYRDGYGIFACCGILHNHESSRRGEKFLTRKVTKYVADLFWSLKLDYKIPKLQLGNMDSYRDWSDARDMVEAMYLIITHDKPRDYVVSSDKCHSVRDFVEQAFKYIGIKDYMDYIEINPDFFRPSEVDYLCGESSDIRQELGWKPKHSFGDLVKSMVNHDIETHPKYNEHFLQRFKDYQTFKEVQETQDLQDA